MPRPLRRGLASDLGAGIGRHALALAAMGQQVTALDAAGASTAAVAAAAFTRGLAVETVEAPMTELPFDTASFDHVLAWNVIYHGEEAVVRRTISEVARVTRPGGSFMATMLSARRLPVEQAKGKGQEISRNTRVFEGEGDKIHPHYFCTAPDLLSLLWGFEVFTLSTGRTKSLRFLALASSGGASGMTAELIEGARVILEDRIETASVRIEDGRIAGIDVACDGAAVILAGSPSLRRPSSTSTATPSSASSCRAPASWSRWKPRLRPTASFRPTESPPPTTP